MSYDLPSETEDLAARRAAELGLSPSDYIARLIELDAGGDAVEDALLEAVDEPAVDWDWDGTLARGLARARQQQ